MVQVENEVGTYGSKRDFSPQAQALFEQAVPSALLKGLQLKQTGNWQTVFGEQADEFFHAWSIARFAKKSPVRVKPLKKLCVNVGF